MSSHKRVAPPDDPDRALIKGIAMDIGKEVVAYVELMYPQAISATSSTFRLSLRNCIHNQIIGAIDVMQKADGDKAAILDWLAKRKAHRREMKAYWKVIRETDWEHSRAMGATPEDVFDAVHREKTRMQDE